jgi:hypothetical protein
MRSRFSSVKASLGSCLSPRRRHRKIILAADFRNYREIRSIPWNWRPGLGVLFAMAAADAERESGTES